MNGTHVFEHPVNIRKLKRHFAYADERRLFDRIPFVEFVFPSRQLAAITCISLEFLHLLMSVLCSLRFSVHQDTPVHCLIPGPVLLRKLCFVRFYWCAENGLRSSACHVLYLFYSLFHVAVGKLGQRPSNVPIAYH